MCVCSLDINVFYATLKGFWYFQNIKKSKRATYHGIRVLIYNTEKQEKLTGNKTNIEHNSVISIFQLCLVAIFFYGHSF